MASYSDTFLKVDWCGEHDDAKLDCIACKERGRIADKLDAILDTSERWSNTGLYSRIAAYASELSGAS